MLTCLAPFIPSSIPFMIPGVCEWQLCTVPHLKCLCLKWVCQWTSIPTWISVCTSSSTYTSSAFPLSVHWISSYQMTIQEFFTGVISKYAHIALEAGMPLNLTVRKTCSLFTIHCSFQVCVCCTIFLYFLSIDRHHLWKHVHYHTVTNIEVCTDRWERKVHRPEQRPTWW
jgi:hypothetical protein